MDSLVIASIEVRKDIEKQFAEFKKKKADFGTLINEAVEALSPAQLLDEYPLIRMSSENKEWLGEVIHALYCERTGIREIVKALTEKFRSICEAHTLLSRILKGENDVLLKLAGEHPFKSYYKHIQELSRMISSLPHEVQVV